jgi:hypothetical protein
VHKSLMGVVCYDREELKYHPLDSYAHAPIAIRAMNHKS